MSNLNYVNLVTPLLVAEPDSSFSGPSATKSDSSEASAHETPSFNRKGFFDFLGLPPEFRTMIYKLLFKDVVPCCIGTQGKRHIPGAILLSVCTQTFDETFCLLYRGYLLLQPFDTSLTSGFVDAPPAIANTSPPTLARMKMLYIDLEIAPGMTSSIAPIPINVFPQATALKHICVTVILHNSSTCEHVWVGTDLHNNPLILGLIFNILIQIPKRFRICWHIYIRDGHRHIVSVGKDFIKKFEVVQGLQYGNE